MKKYLAILFLLLAACTKENYEMEYHIKDMSAYSFESQSFLEIEEAAFYEFVEAGQDGLFYLSNERCPTCQKTSSLLNELLKKEDAFVYYLDAYKLDDSKRMIEILDKDLYANEKGEKEIRTPHLFTIKDGKLKDSVIGNGEDIEKMYEKLIKDTK